MSVDRPYAPRISTEAENSSARQNARDVKDAGVSGEVDEDINSVEKTSDAELRGLLRSLNDVLPGAGRLLRAAFELKMPDQSGNFSSVGKESARSEASSTPLMNQPKLLEEPVVTDSHPFLQPQNDLSNAGRDTIEFNAANEPRAAQSSESPVAAPTHAGIANQFRQFQKAFQAQGPAMSQQDAVDLLAVIHQLGEAFFQQAQNSVTKQEFEREKIALRRLIESKGK